MNKLSIPFLAALLCLSSFAAASAQQYGNGQYAGPWGNGYNAQCSNNGNASWHRRDRDRDRDDNDDRGNGGNNGYYGNGNNGGYYNNNGGYYGNNNNAGYYGNNGGYYGNANQRQYASACNNSNAGNAVVRGSIVGVNGNQVTLQNRSSQTMTINDQPALNNQSSGRVEVGRFVTAYGYWRNGVFFATRMV